MKEPNTDPFKLLIPLHCPAVTLTTHFKKHTELTLLPYVQMTLVTHAYLVFSSQEFISRRTLPQSPHFKMPLAFIIAK